MDSEVFKIEKNLLRNPRLYILSVGFWSHLVRFSHFSADFLLIPQKITLYDNFGAVGHTK